MLPHLARLFSVTVFAALLLSSLPSAVHGQYWSVGQLVGLRAGTCIRQGPGTNYPAHTTVPEDNWTVRVIGGPRTAEGFIWWDTSRSAAGDPSGGTGWVMQDQTDTNCSSPNNQQPRIPPVALVVPVPIPAPDPINYQGWLGALQAWWFAQTPVVKLVFALVVIVLTSSIWRFVGSMLLGLIAAVVSSVILWLFLDFIRPVWVGTWYGLAQPIFGGGAPDLALLIALLPLASWAISAVRHLLSGRI